LYQAICTARTRKRIRFHLKFKSHPFDIAQSFLQSYMGKTILVLAYICMHFQWHVVPDQHLIDVVGYFYRFAHLHDQPFFDLHTISPNRTSVYKHESSVFFPDYGNDRGKIDGMGFYLGIRAHANPDLVAFVAFLDDGLFHDLIDTGRNGHSGERFPIHSLIFFKEDRMPLYSYTVKYT